MYPDDFGEFTVRVTNRYGSAQMAGFVTFFLLVGYLRFKVSLRSHLFLVGFGIGCFMLVVDYCSLFVCKSVVIYFWLIICVLVVCHDYLVD